MPKVLITGASGFIGSFLVEEALNQNFEVYAGIRKTSSKQFLNDERIHFFETQLNNKKALYESFVEFKKSHGAFDFVIHNAGATKVRDPKDFYTINQNFTQNLVEALQESECLNGKFVLMSSLAAMGPGSDETMLPIKESDTPNPVSHYGRSKLFVERYLEEVKDLKYLIFRPTGVYGPREKDYLIFFKTLLNKIEPYIGFKEQKITFIYVKDLCKVVIDSLRSEHENKTYCVTDGYTYSSFDFANISKEILKAKTIKIFVPLFIAKTIAAINSLIAKVFGGSPTLNNEKIKEISRLNWQCETDGIKKDFNFVAEYDLDKGVRESIEWYKANGWL